jgi:crotonobetainyl-CoA:carnitine CoA-transferase CaiB-like acyl-CoA transferase
LCTTILVDMGAEVIKVERPGGGDESRRVPPLVQREGAGFLTLHRGKKSVVSATPGAVREAAPAYGQHPEEVLRALGYAAEEIRALQGSGEAVPQEVRR